MRVLGNQHVDGSEIRHLRWGFIHYTSRETVSLMRGSKSCSKKGSIGEKHHSDSIVHIDLCGLPRELGNAAGPVKHKANCKTHGEEPCMLVEPELNSLFVLGIHHRPKGRLATFTKSGSNGFTSVFSKPDSFQPHPGKEPKPHHISAFFIIFL